MNFSEGLAEKILVREVELKLKDVRRKYLRLVPKHITDIKKKTKNT